MSPRYQNTSGDGEVGRDGEHVPEQRRREVHPEPVLVRVRHEIQREPRASGVQQREDARRT